MKYPKTPESLDRRKKLTSEQIAHAKKRVSQGESYTSVAREYKVAITTLIRHVNTEQREKALQYQRKRNQELWRTDKAHRERKRKQHQEEKKYKLKVLPETQKYYNVAQLERRKYIKDTGLNKQSKCCLENVISSKILLGNIEDRHYVCTKCNKRCETLNNK